MEGRQPKKKKTLTVSDIEATKSTPQQLKTTPKSRNDLAIAIISNQSQEQRDATNSPNCRLSSNQSQKTSDFF
jgi:hypothetical protein